MNYIFKKYLTYCGLAGLAVLLSSVAYAQSNCFAHVELNRNSVYVQQSFRVTVTVYTSTWFTAPLEFDHLQVPNAFIIPFEKSQPGVFYVDGKQYSGIQFYYIVFPYRTGKFTVPPIQITAHTPPEGSSTPRDVQLHTPAKPFTVRDVPQELKAKGAWFVANDVYIKDEWSKPLDQLKVGDVLSRTITVSARGTLPQFIPDLTPQEKVDWASLYPKDAVLKDTRDENDANGESRQVVTYLFEKKGDFVIPPVEVVWWNPYTAKQSKKSLAAVQIHVADNPHLGMLTSLKDSLQASQIVKPQAAKPKGPFTILGLHWYVFAGLLLGGLMIGFILVKQIPRVYRMMRRKHQEYLDGEAYRFHRFQQADEAPSSFSNRLYAWWDRIKRNKSASVLTTLRTDGAAEPTAALQEYWAGVYDSREKPDLKAIEKKLKRSLKAYRTSKKHSPEHLNPLSNRQLPY